MRVVVSRTGGFAGLTRTWAVSLESAPDPGGLAALVEACPWGEMPSEHAAHGADRLCYRLEAGPRQAVMSEQQVVGPWRELVDQVRQISKTTRGTGPLGGTPSG